MIKSLSCTGFRGFANGQRLELAVPNGRRGSGLTVLVGPNGGGKSTLVECFELISKGMSEFGTRQKNRLSGRKVVIEVEDVDGRKGVWSYTDGVGKSVWEGNFERPAVHYLWARRELGLRRLTESFKLDKEFNEVFYRVLGKKLDFILPDRLGEGTFSLLLIVDALFRAQEREIIVIDEPELSLHPQLQNRLLDEIMEVSRRVQVVISTHSANLLSIESAVNEGQIARVHEENGKSVISCIDERCREYLRSFSNDVYNPHTMGLDAKGCFFAEDGLVITEGQEDVMLIPKVLEQLGIEQGIQFFGFGAGGASNIRQIAHILNCLGFLYVGALFDGDKEEEFLKFKEEYKDFKGYQAWLLPADDIRDKCAVEKSAKRGLLNEDFIINKEFDIEQIRGLFNEILRFTNGETKSKMIN